MKLERDVIGEQEGIEGGCEHRDGCVEGSCQKTEYVELTEWSMTQARSKGRRDWESGVRT